MPGIPSTPYVVAAIWVTLLLGVGALVVLVARWLGVNDGRPQGRAALPPGQPCGRSADWATGEDAGEDLSSQR
ncbi:MAG: hypothetical protein ACYDEA_11875 [Candidatus Dormibacteria bacterium]